VIGTVLIRYYTQKKNSDWTKDAFDLTTRLLQINPELYTVWNYRRYILLNGLFPERYHVFYQDGVVPAHYAIRTPGETNLLLAADLSMTTTALKAHPKVYWIWNHRQWCLENVPDGPGQDSSNLYGWKKANWDRELFVVEKMLDADPRNCPFLKFARCSNSFIKVLQFMPGIIEDMF
jgi:geranylgeranyl transferase type-2 subunit alpha